MDSKEEIRVLERRSERLKKSAKSKKIKWPVDYQLRVLKLLEQGYSPQFLTSKLNIPVQTFYHWRRFWKTKAQDGTLKKLNFHEVSISDNLEDSTVDKKELIHIAFPKGAIIQVCKEFFEDLLNRGLL